MKLPRFLLCIAILVCLLVSCTNKDNLRIEQPWCTILSATIIAGGIALTGGTAGAIAGGAIIGGTLSLPFCHKETK